MTSNQFLILLLVFLVFISQMVQGQFNSSSSSLDVGQFNSSSLDLGQFNSSLINAINSTLSDQDSDQQQPNSFFLDLSAEIPSSFGDSIRQTTGQEQQEEVEDQTTQDDSNNAVAFGQAIQDAFEEFDMDFNFNQFPNFTIDQQNNDANPFSQNNSSLDFNQMIFDFQAQFQDGNQTDFNFNINSELFPSEVLQSVQNGTDFDFFQAFNSSLNQNQSQNLNQPAQVQGSGRIVNRLVETSLYVSGQDDGYSGASFQDQQQQFIDTVLWDFPPISPAILDSIIGSRRLLALQHSFY